MVFLELGRIPPQTACQSCLLHAGSNCTPAPLWPPRSALPTQTPRGPTSAVPAKTSKCQALWDLPTLANPVSSRWRVQQDRLPCCSPSSWTCPSHMLSLRGARAPSCLQISTQGPPSQWGEPQAWPWPPGRLQAAICPVHGQQQALLSAVSAVSRPESTRCGAHRTASNGQGH